MHDIAQMLMMAAGGAAGQVSRTAGGTAAATITPASSYTTSALGIGTAASDRMVVAAVMHRNAAGYTIPITTGVTIGGVAASLLIRASSDPYLEGSLWGAMVPSGSTASVVVTADRNIDDYALTLEAIYGAVTTPAYTVASAPSSGGGDITGVRNGLVLASMMKSSDYFSGSVTLSNSAFYGIPASTAFSLPTTTGAVSPLTSGSGGLPYVAVSFAPK